MNNPMRDRMQQFEAQDKETEQRLRSEVIQAMIEYCRFTHKKPSEYIIEFNYMLFCLAEQLPHYFSKK